uniref:FYVE-type domain-containing protein n=1 Tax=Peronospora matthiolae TaxID=2874970 RepID=A0AAV1VAA5_9STRA
MAASAFPQQITTGLSALVAYCFQPSQPCDFSDKTQFLKCDNPSRRLVPTEKCSTDGLFLNAAFPPQWVKDDFIEACGLCNVEFGLLKRKHHCRSCGLIFCGHCAATFDRVVKLGYIEPVRLCNDCTTTIQSENDFFEKFLPLLEIGDVFTKYGLLRKRQVHLKYVRSTSLFQYQQFNPVTKSYKGDTEAIPLDKITSVREVSVGPDHAKLGILIAVDSQEHRFDAATEQQRQQWMDAIVGARRLRDALLVAEREKRAKQVEKENDEIRDMSENLLMMEKRRATFQEDRMRRRGEKREQLRAKYNLAIVAS